MYSVRDLYNIVSSILGLLLTVRGALDNKPNVLRWSVVHTACTIA